MFGRSVSKRSLTPAIFDEPLHATLEARQMVDHFRVQGLHSEKRNKADHGAHFERERVTLREM